MLHVMPSLRELRQKDCEFEACMGYIRESVVNTLSRSAAY